MYDLVFETLSHHIRNQVMTLPFDGFADLCVQLLTALGYADVTRLSRRYFKGGYRGSGSADLQASITTDVSTVPVLVMLKQFRRSIQKRFIYELAGRMALTGVPRGIVITTTTFRPGAIAAASRLHGAKIDLIDGKELVRLLVAHRIGVTATPQFHVDRQFFAELAGKEEA